MFRPLVAFYRRTCPHCHLCTKSNTVSSQGTCHSASSAAPLEDHKRARAGRLLSLATGSEEGVERTHTQMSVRIGEGAVVCDGAVLQGDISIGANTIIFPGARIQCHENSGTIVIGRGCVIEEGASLVQAAEGEMRLGVGNLLEVGCTVSAPEVWYDLSSVNVCGPFQSSQPQQTARER